MENTFWASTHELSPLYQRLWRRVPNHGSVEHPRGRNRQLERLRIASNAYYDIFNNGGENRPGEIARYFGPGIRGLCRAQRWNLIHERIEARMASYVLAAAHEQGFTVFPPPAPPVPSQEECLAAIGYV